MKETRPIEELTEVCKNKRTEYQESCFDWLENIRHIIGNFFISKGFKSYEKIDPKDRMKSRFFYIDPNTDIGIEIDYSSFSLDSYIYVTERIYPSFVYMVNDDIFSWGHDMLISQYMKSHPDFNIKLQAGLEFKLDRDPEEIFRRYQQVISKKVIKYIPEILKIIYPTEITKKQRKSKLLALPED